jgi:hypothetical protein
LLEAAEEAGRADAAREHGDAHTRKCVRSAVRRCRRGRTRASRPPHGWRFEQSVSTHPA